MASMVAQTVIPNPDPSAVTSDAIDRRVQNSEDKINARIDGMSKAVEVFQADLTRVPTQLDRAIISLRDLLEARLVAIEADIKGVHKAIDSRDSTVATMISHLRDLVFEKIEKLAEVTRQQFIGIDSQFAERDTRTDQRAGDTKLAVDAAFAAAKEATSKIEAGFTKSIDGQQDLLNNTTQATNDKISDLKDRVTAIENRTIGLTAANSGNRDVSNDASARTFSMLSIAVSIISVVVVIAIATHSFH
jgi:hypothetical protein